MADLRNFPVNVESAGYTYPQSFPSSQTQSRQHFDYPPRSHTAPMLGQVQSSPHPRPTLVARDAPSYHSTAPNYHSAPSASRIQQTYPRPPSPGPQPRPRGHRIPPHSERPKKGDVFMGFDERKPLLCSAATLENARYHLSGIPTSEHPNEDRHFTIEGDNFRVFAVLDGHDGPRAAGFASHYLMGLFDTDSWKSLARASSQEQRKNIPLALTEFFQATENEFFSSIRSAVDDKKTIQAIIPPGMNSYQAYQSYPLQVARLQELEPKIAGGTTVALVIQCNRSLYVANVGDSRIILVSENEKGIQQEVQLSRDHGVENLDELKRLTELGLSRQQLERAGRLGSQENTRSIGDYYIKAGYKDVDTLQSCTEQPGTCEPYVAHVPLTQDSKYIIIMTDGVYKSIEAGFKQSATIDSNKVLLSIANRQRSNIRSFDVLADRVLDRVRHVHEDTFKVHAAEDVRSPVAVACRKRDDMTLVIHQLDSFQTI